MLAIVLLLTVPTVALAAAPITFDATCDMVEVDPGTTVVGGNRVRTIGLEMLGTVTAPAPLGNPFDGAYIFTHASSNASLVTGKGTEKGVFIIIGADPTIDIMVGNFSGKIWMTGKESAAGAGHMNVIKGIGAFAHVQSSGTYTAEADLGADPVTLKMTMHVRYHE